MLDIDEMRNIVENYSGNSLLEDLKLTAAQIVVNDCSSVTQAISTLGCSAGALNDWFRGGLIMKPKRYRTREDTMFPKGVDPRVHLESLKSPKVDPNYGRL